jgi:hypothetical protein
MCSRGLLADCNFNRARAAPSLPHQVPNEHAENAGTRKRRHPEEPLAPDDVDGPNRGGF